MNRVVDGNADDDGSNADRNDGNWIFKQHNIPQGEGPTERYCTDNQQDTFQIPIIVDK